MLGSYLPVKTKYMGQGFLTCFVEGRLFTGVYCGFNANSACKDIFYS